MRGAPGLQMVVGASGTGKSSLVRAGLVPRLEGAREDWLVIEPFRPGLDPFTELAMSLEQAFQAQGSPDREELRWPGIRSALVESAERIEPPAMKDTPAESEQGEARDAPSPSAHGNPEEALDEHDERLRRIIAELEALGRSSPAGSGARMQPFLDWSLEDLRRIGRGLAPKGAAPLPGTLGSTALVDFANHLRRLDLTRREARVLVIVDQFEELLGTEDADSTATTFLRLLRRSVEVEGSPVMVLGTLRSDFLSSFQTEDALRGIDCETLSLGAMRPEALRQVIEGPEALGAVTLETGLADALINDTGTPDALPLLAFTLRKLWVEYGQDGELTLDEYRQLGGLTGAVSQEADACLAQVPPERLDDVRHAFVEMARITEDGAYARQPLLWDGPVVEPVRDDLEAFVAGRLLSVRMRGGDDDPAAAPIVEVAHESLFRSWAPLTQWLDAHRGEKLLLAQLGRDVLVWEERDQDETVLWSGGRLHQAVELLDAGRLEPAVQAFVQAAEDRRTALERAEAERRRKVARAKTAAVVGFAGLAAFAFWKKVQADRATARALDLVTVSVAAQIVDRDPHGAAAVLLEVATPARTSSASLWMRETLNRGLSTLVDSGGAPLLKGAMSEAATLVAAGTFSGDVTLARADGRGQAELLHASDTAITAVAFSPDGNTLAVTDALGGTHIWTVADSARDGSWVVDAEPRTVVGDTGSARGVTFVGSDRLVVASDGLRLLATDGAPLGEVPDAHGGRVIRTLEASADGSRLLTAGEDGTARVWRADLTGASVALPADTVPLNGAWFDAGGERVITASAGGSVGLWGVSGTVLARLGARDVPATAAALDPGGRRAAAGWADGAVQLWRLAADGTVTDSLDLSGQGAPVTVVTFSPSGHRLLVADREGGLRTWGAEGDDAASFTGHGQEITAAGFDATGEAVWTTSRDGTVRRWHARGKPDPTRLAGLGGRATAAGFDPSGSRAVVAVDADWRRLVSLSLDGTDAAPEDTELLDDVAMTDLIVPPTAGTVVTVHANGMYLRDAATGEPAEDAPWGATRQRAIAFSEGGSTVATGDGDRIVIWEEDDSGGAPAPRTLGHHPGLLRLAFDPEGSRLASTGTDGSVRIWRVDAGEVSTTLLAGGEPLVGPAAFSPDGRRLVTWDGTGTAQLWTLRSGASRPLSGHEGRVTSAGFGPDGRILTTSVDGSARVWDGEGQDNPVVLADGGAPVLAAAFSADGEHVHTVSDDAVVRRWSAITHEGQRALLEAVSNRCLPARYLEEALGRRPDAAAERLQRCREERAGRR